MEQMKVNDLVVALQKTSFKNQTKYAIDKELKKKYNLTSVKKSDYIKALEQASLTALTEESESKSLTNVKEQINDDVLYNILLQADFKELEHLCMTNKAAVKICNDANFWKTKLRQDQYLLLDTNYKSLYIKFNKAKKQMDDILHMNHIETNRYHLRTDGDIDFINRDYFTSIADFYKQIPFIRLNQKYNDYSIYKIRFKLTNGQYSCELMLLGESKYLSDAITFTINYPFSKLKILFIHFIYIILNKQDNEHYLECIDDNDVPFIFYKQFDLNDYNDLMDRKYFNTKVFYARRGIWEGLNL